MKFTIFTFLLLLLVHLSTSTNCVAPGSFRYVDPTCKKYYTCRLLLGLYYIKDDFECGMFQKFNPTTQICDYTSVCINSFCDNQPPLQTMPDPNAINPTCRATYIRCMGITNQYPIIEDCLSGCC